MWIKPQHIQDTIIICGVILKIEINLCTREMFVVIDALTTRISENLKWRLVPQKVKINVSAEDLK